MKEITLFDNQLIVIIPDGVTTVSPGQDFEGLPDTHTQDVYYSDGTALRFSFYRQTNHWARRLKREDTIVTDENIAGLSEYYSGMFADFFDDVTSELLDVNGNMYSVFFARHTESEDNQLFVFTNIYVNDVFLFVMVTGYEPGKLKKIMASLTIPKDQSVLDINLRIDEAAGVPAQVMLWEQKMLNI